MTKRHEFTLALFYCRNTPDSAEKERQLLEMEYGEALRLFPLACGGRMDPIHLLKALEEFADAAYLIVCPEGACRYSEGNTRARKRVGRTGEVLASIGMERERVGVVFRTEGESLATLVRVIMNKVVPFGVSPVFTPHPKGKGQKGGRGRAGGSRSRKAGPRARVGVLGAGEMV